MEGSPPRRVLRLSCRARVEAEALLPPSLGRQPTPKDKSREPAPPLWASGSTSPCHRAGHTERARRHEDRIEDKMMGHKNRPAERRDGRCPISTELAAARNRNRP